MSRERFVRPVKGISVQLISNVASAVDGDRQAVTSLHSTKESSEHLSGYSAVFSARFRDFSAHCSNLVRTLCSRPVLAVVCGIGLFVAPSRWGCSQESQTSDIRVENGRVTFPPLSRDVLDFFFDSLRAGSPFVPPPLRPSQVVDANTSGMWAGTRTEVNSHISEVILRFKPTDDARLERADLQRRKIGTDLLAEEFDVSIQLSPTRMIIAHPLAETKIVRTGLSVELSDRQRSFVRTEYVSAVRDAGMYISVPSMTRSEAGNAWGMFICPRKLVFTSPTKGAPEQYELHPSPYQLSEVKVTMSEQAEPGTLPGTKRERVSLESAFTANLPASYETKDEVTAISPWINLPYKPQRPFEFFRFPQEEQIQEGMFLKVELQNAAGYVRRQNFTHVFYAQALHEPSPISVIVNSNRVYRDEGVCYAILSHRSIWSEYERKEPIPQ